MVNTAIPQSDGCHTSQPGSVWQKMPRWFNSFHAAAPQGTLECFLGPCLHRESQGRDWARTGIVAGNRRQAGDYNVELHAKSGVLIDGKKCHAPQPRGSRRILSPARDCGGLSGRWRRATAFFIAWHICRKIPRPHERSAARGHWISHRVRGFWNPHGITDEPIARIWGRRIC